MTFKKILKKLLQKAHSLLYLEPRLALGKKRYKTILSEGERYDPKIFGLMNLSDPCHIPRYEFAKTFIAKNNTVLDIACGTGYGTALVSASCKTIIGVDISSEAIDYARKKNSTRNIRYMLSDFSSNTITADVVVSFETIEHIRNNSIASILNKLLDFSKNKVIGSIPYKEPESNNPHHFYFNLDENSFRCLDDRGNITFYYQTSDGKIHSQKPEEENIQNLIFVFHKSPNEQENSGIKKKFALVSHILPPYPSGQAIMLYRLFKNLDPKSYCLVSCLPQANIPYSCTATAELSACHHYLKTACQPPILEQRRKAIWGVPFNLIFRTLQIIKICKKEKVEFIIACTGEFFDLPSACLASKLLRIPFVSYIFDDYAYRWLGRWRFLSKFMEPFILRSARLIIVPNEFLREEHQKRYNLESSIIHNPCNIPDIHKLDQSERIFNKEYINIVFAGAIYQAHYDAFRNLIKAISDLKHLRIKLHIFTTFHNGLTENGIEGPAVEYHSHIQEQDVPNILRQADILFLPLAFHSPYPKVIKTSAPGKAGEYLSVGRPILVHAPDDSFISWYFRTNNCGIVVTQETPSALSKAIEDLVSNEDLKNQLSEQSRKQAEKDFEVRKIQNRFIEILNQVC